MGDDVVTCSMLRNEINAMVARLHVLETTASNHAVQLARKDEIDKQQREQAHRFLSDEWPALMSRLERMELDTHAIRNDLTRVESRSGTAVWLTGLLLGVMLACVGWIVKS